MEKELNTDKWIKYWNLYDYNCWPNYYNHSEIKRAYEKSREELRTYMHNKILVPAIEQVEYNITQLDERSKFLYWFRFREEFLIVTDSYDIDVSNDLDEQVKPHYNKYITHIQGIREKYKPKKLEYDYFKWFYVTICILKIDANIFFNEMLFNLPLLEKADSQTKNIDKLKRERNDKVIQIYNFGTIDTLVNNLEDNKEKLKGLSHLEVVEQIISHFKRQIENNGLFKLLYEGPQKKLRHENSAQQLFFSVAQIFCFANDLDISPETNSGAGCVDFKFSKGMDKKINVEIKYSSNSNLKHGLQSQLKKYDEAEHTEYSFYLIIQVDNNDKLIKEIKAIDSKANPEKQKVKVVDGRSQKSASIRS